MCLMRFGVSESLADCWMRTIFQRPMVKLRSLLRVTYYLKQWAEEECGMLYWLCSSMESAAPHAVRSGVRPSGIVWL